MDLLKPEGSWADRMIDFIGPMFDIASRVDHQLDEFKEQAFAEFDEIGKQIKKLKEEEANQKQKSEEEFVVPKLPVRKTRTKKGTKKSQQSMSNLSGKSSAMESSSSKDLSESSNDRSSRALRRERSKRPSVGSQSPPTNPSRPSKVRKLNKLPKQEEDDKDKRPDEDVSSNKAEVNENEVDEECIIVEDRKMEVAEDKKTEGVQINEEEQMDKMEVVPDGKKEVEHYDNKSEDDHCDISQFNDDGLFTSTPRPSCTVGKLRREISDQTAIAPSKGLVGNMKDRQIDVVDGVGKKEIVSEMKNTKNGYKENFGFKTPDRVLTPNRMVMCSPILSGSVKKRIEAIEKAGGKLIECSPKTLGTKVTTEKKYENPMRITRNMQRKALYHDLNNHGSVTKLNSKALQEKTNTIKTHDEKEYNAAHKKKEELIKATAEEKQRRREEKGKKVIAQREAEEKEKLELAIKMQKEKEEKFKKLQKERDEKMKEENLKKKLLAEKKAVEMEERRKEDEAARIARLKEIEEEEKRKAAQKIRMEAEKMRLKKLEEHKIRQAEKEREEERLKAAAASKQNEKKLKGGKDPEDYGADDMNAEDSTDDESKPKRDVPSWAEEKNRKPLLMQQSYVPDTLIHKWFHKKDDKKPNLESLFGKNLESRLRSRPRTSSVMWDSKHCFDNSTLQ